MVLLKLLLDRQVLLEVEVKLSSGAGMLSGKVLPSDARLSSSSPSDLLTVPPGFVEGIVFKQGKEPPIPDAIPPPQAISIAELMSADEWLVAAVSSEEEEEVDGITSSLVSG